MLLVTIVSIVFILSFTLIFIWIKHANKKDPEEEKMGVLMTGFVSGVLALILSGVAAFFLFIVFGSTSIINTMFTLDLSKKDLILMSVVYVAFIFTVDNVFQILIKLLTKNIYLFYFVMLWLRMVVFYLIGSFFHLNHETNLIISGGVSLILSMLEFIYEIRRE